MVEDIAGCRRFGRTLALDQVDLKFHCGAVFGLVGENERRGRHT